MAKSKTKQKDDKLNLILDAIKEIKGKEIITINLEDVGYAICDYFVICHGTSTTQVDAISDSVERKLRKANKISPHHVEGKNNSFWVLMDYGDILVHIFLEEKRAFYNLEDLWADGVIERIDDV